MKKILITGASGALGKEVVAHINKLHNFHIISLARNANREISGEVVICDICNIEQMSTTIKTINPNYILHLAATFTNSFNESYKVNVESSNIILDYVARNKLDTRVLLIGSAAEYGMIQPEENPINENHKLYPVSVYGVSKAWQTQLIGLYTALGVNVLCARIFNLFGPGLSAKLFAGRLLYQIKEVLSGCRDFIELGSLTAIRDYLSTTEAARQLVDIIQFGEAGEVYHVASGIPISMYEFLQFQLKQYGLDESIVHILPDFSNRQGYDVPVIYADTTKTKALGIQNAESNY